MYFINRCTWVTEKGLPEAQGEDMDDLEGCENQADARKICEKNWQICGYAYDVKNKKWKAKERNTGFHEEVAFGENEEE